MTVDIEAPFVLKRDVLLIPCAELSDDLRARIAFEEGDFTLSVRHGRQLSQVIDRETAALLERFREPRTIVDAIVEVSESLGKDAEDWLDEMLPHLGLFVQKRVLVQAGSEDEKEIRPQFESGTAFGEWKIVRCASLVDDAEIYQLSSGGRFGRREAALKIARVSTPRLQRMFENEAAVLRRLDDTGIAPRLIESGMHEERPYLVIEWIAGLHPGVAAAQRRHDRASMIDLCASIASAYATLHARGVLHADVHPKNILAGEDKITLLDFGFSRLLDQPPGDRGGVTQYFEPEFIAAKRQEIVLPASAAGEQYAVAAMLYFLLAGDHYVAFRYEKEEMERQIETEPPLPFASRGIPPWPEVERILFRALEKDPARRFGSMAELAARLAEVRDVTIRESLATPVSAEAHAFLDAMLQSFSRGGAMFVSRYPTPPTASINYGCAGAAVALLRIAETRGDPELLALADIWRSRAVALIGSDGAYTAEGEEARPHEVTPYHTESGIHAAAAMIAESMGDLVAQRRAVRAFVEASSKPCRETDLTLGRSGSLLAAAMLLEISAGLPEAAALRAFGAETMQAIWSELDQRGPIEAAREKTFLGMAHGWTGFLYAALRWCAASGDALPARLVERLHELAALKSPRGRGVFWRPTIGAGPDAIMPSWCNGSAGQVFLFTLAHRLLGDDEWLALAELAAWNNWDEPRVASTLCCGTAGRAYALLNLYKHTGATEWLSRARQLANHAAAFASANPERPNALWKGELGIAVLIADLASPENARMPFFE